LVSFHNQLNDGWFRAAGRAHLAIAWEAGFALLQIGTFIGLLMTGKGMLWLATADLAISSVSAAGLYLTGRRLLPAVVPAGQPIERADVRLFFRKGLAFLMEPVRRSIYLQGTLLVTRIALGAEAVAILATLRTVANSIAQMYNSVQATIFPELQRAVAEHAMASARRLFRLALGLSALLATGGIVGLGLFGPWIYAKWTADMLHPPANSWLLLLAGIAANAVWWPAAATFRAVNQPERYAVAGVACALLGVAISAALVGSWGVAGALAGLLAMEVLMAVFVLPASCRILGQSLAELPRDLLALRYDALRILHALRVHAKPATDGH
jgi:O-antigen/teichoic acid export membrane protein